MSLLIALGFMLIFTITTVAIAREVVANERGAKHSDSADQSFSAAEAVLNSGMDWVRYVDDGTLAQGSKYPTTGTWTPANPSWDINNPLYKPEGASDWRWWAYKTSGPPNPVWVIDAQATVLGRTREVQAQIGRGPDPDAPPPVADQDVSAWQGAYSTNPPGSGCMSLQPNAIISETFYTAGDLCLLNNAGIKAATAKTMVYAGGQIILSNNAYIGETTNKLYKVTAVNGCTYGGKVIANCGNGSSSHIWTNTFSSAQEVVTKPPVDPDFWYQNASPGPNHPCISGSFPPGFDNDGVRNKSMGNVDIETSVAYDCIGPDVTLPPSPTLPEGGTIPGGQIKWDPPSASNNYIGRLTLRNNTVVFIDGNLYEFGKFAVYQGRATIYYGGTGLLDNNSKICANETCTAWDPNSNLVVFGVLNNGVKPPYGTWVWTVDNNSIFQGAAYVIGGLKVDNNGVIAGPIVSDGMYYKNNAGYFQPLGDAGLPGGAPGTIFHGAPYVWYSVPNTWREVR